VASSDQFASRSKGEVPCPVSWAKFHVKILCQSFMPKLYAFIPSSVVVALAQKKEPRREAGARIQLRRQCALVAGAGVAGAEPVGAGFVGAGLAGEGVAGGAICVAAGLLWFMAVLVPFSPG
jgi:hypothetical protein